MGYAEEVLDYFLEKYQGHIALASSLGIEDQVLTAMICGIDATTRIFTLDTGRLFPETYSLIGRTNMSYGIRIPALNTGGYVVISVNWNL